MTEDISNLMPCDKCRILVADDEKCVRHVFKVLLLANLPKCQIDIAVNGTEVTEAFRSVRYKIIVLDARMPVLDGENAFNEISLTCENNNWELPAFIFCSGSDLPLGLEKVVSENPKHCMFRKPVANNDLIEAIRSRLESF